MTELERSELYEKCVVCCAALSLFEREGDARYCMAHRDPGDGNMPPIPLKEFWPKEFPLEHDRFATTAWRAGEEIP